MERLKRLLGNPEAVWGRVRALLGASWAVFGPSGGSPGRRGELEA